MIDVVELECPGVTVAQQHVGFIDIAAEVTKADNLPIQADLSHGSRQGDSVMADVIELECASVMSVAQQHVGFVDIAAEVTKADNLPIQADLSHGRCKSDIVMADVVDFEGSRCCCHAPACRFHSGCR